MLLLDKNKYCNDNCTQPNSANYKRIKLKLKPYVNPNYKPNHMLYIPERQIIANLLAISYRGHLIFFRHYKL